MAKGSHFDSQTVDPGAVVMGRYVVEAQIAEGGMATIHGARDQMTGRKVALKVLYPHYSQNPVVCTRFLDEGRIQRYLVHPNIIDVFDIVETPPLAIVMEFIQGLTLEEYLEEHGPLSNAELLGLMLPVLSAVGFAHKQGVIHRDLKPSNILLEQTATGLVPKVMDFGVAKVSRDHELTADGTTVGTLHYMSPEQIVGSRRIDGRADIYSLGVTMYKLCTGDVPFNASTEFALMMAQVEAPPLPPSELRPGLSAQLEQIILRALEKRPDDRFQTVRELTAALLELKRAGQQDDFEETLSAPMPAELLRYAMMADEVAQDRTRELEITSIDDSWSAGMPSDDSATREIVRPGVSASASGQEAHAAQDAQDDPESTMQLDRARLKAKMRGDRRAAQGDGEDERGSSERPLSGDDLLSAHFSDLNTKDTRPMEWETTRQRDAPDSRAFTRPFERSDKSDEPHRPNQQRRAQASHGSASGPKTGYPNGKSAGEARATQGGAPAAGEQAARRSAMRPRVQSQGQHVGIDRADRPGNNADQDHPLQEGLHAGASGNVRAIEASDDPHLEFGKPAGGAPVERVELRARAAGELSKTSVNRDEVQAEFRRFQAGAGDQSGKKKLYTRLTVAVVVVIIGLIIAIAWHAL